MSARKRLYRGRKAFAKAIGKSERTIDRWRKHPSFPQGRRLGLEIVWDQDDVDAVLTHGFELPRSLGSAPEARP
jgi:predicted DNA-binding transcriptional regulator AlpA